jgi:hypothetical protein
MIILTGSILNYPQILKVMLSHPLQKMSLIFMTVTPKWTILMF